MNCTICARELAPREDKKTCEPCRDRIRALLDGLGLNREELAVLRAQASAAMRVRPALPVRAGVPTACPTCHQLHPSKRAAAECCGNKSA